MSGAFTKSMARNIFYGGTVFFFLLFLALSFDTLSQLPKRDMRANMTPQIAEGKNYGKPITASVATPCSAKVPISHRNWVTSSFATATKASRHSSRAVRKKVSRVAAACLSSISPTSN
jgi:uncharacterized protein (DUF58 family)